jgi:C1A family cysteine protease
VPGVNARYGWVVDRPDHRDWLLVEHETVISAAELPSHVDMRSQCSAVYDQGQLGSCTANAIGGAIEFGRLKQKLQDFVPSRLFIYYNERLMEGTVDSDSGAQIRDGVKSVATLGAPSEADWTYDIDRFTEKPPAKAYSDAKHDLVSKYLRVNQNHQLLRSCLASGYPFVFGFTVYESFESQEVADTGVAPLPKHGESVVGGHAVMAVGYDDASQRYLVRNSWGDGWGQHGYFTLPYTYLENKHLASDFWTIRLVTSS